MYVQEHQHPWFRTDNIDTYINTGSNCRRGPLGVLINIGVVSLTRVFK